MGENPLRPRGLLADAGLTHQTVTTERRLFRVACHAALIDLRPALATFSALVHPTDYTLTNALGARLHREGHPGLVSRSVRHPIGLTVAESPTRSTLPSKTDTNRLSLRPLTIRL